MLTVEPRSLGGLDELPSLWIWRCKWLCVWSWGFRCEAEALGAISGPAHRPPRRSGYGPRNPCQFQTLRFSWKQELGTKPEDISKATSILSIFFKLVAGLWAICWAGVNRAAWSMWVMTMPGRAVAEQVPCESSPLATSKPDTNTCSFVLAGGFGMPQPNAENKKSCYFWNGFDAEDKLLAPDFSLSWNLIARMGMLGSFWTPCVFKAGTNKGSKSLSQFWETWLKLFKNYPRSKCFSALGNKDYL